MFLRVVHKQIMQSRGSDQARVQASFSATWHPPIFEAIDLPFCLESFVSSECWKTWYYCNEYVPSHDDEGHLILRSKDVLDIPFPISMRIFFSFTLVLKRPFFSYLFFLLEGQALVVYHTKQVVYKETRNGFREYTHFRWPIYQINTKIAVSNNFEKNRHVNVQVICMHVTPSVP